MIRCAFTPCGRQIPNSLAMCKMHWRKVRPETKRAVYAAAKPYSACNPRTMKDDEFRKLKTAYYDALMRACFDVAVAEGLMTETQARQQLEKKLPSKRKAPSMGGSAT